MSLGKFLIDRTRTLLKGLNYGQVALFLPALIYLPGMLGWIPYPAGDNTYTDLLLTHYPYSLILKNTLLQDYTIPLWTNLIYSGNPFLSNPLTGFWYLPAWIALLFPLPEGISILLGFHAIFGSLGFYNFMREEGLGHEAALLGGLAFGMMPKLNIHYGAGHVSLIYAISWTPWLFFISKRDNYGWKTGAVAAFLFIADPRWAVFAGLIWITYKIAHRHLAGRNLQNYFFQAGITALLMSSPMIVPLLEFMKLSTRSLLTTAEKLILSMPPQKLLGLVFPGSSGNIEWFSYIGGLPLVLFVIQLLDPESRKKNAFWTIWAFLSIFIAFGSNLPGVDIFTHLPGIAWLRVPARSLFLLGFSLIVITVRTIDWMIVKNNRNKQIKLASFGFLVASIVFSLGMIILAPELKLKAYWGLLVLGISSIICIGLTTIRKRSIWPLVICTLIVIDCCGVGFINNEYKSREVVFQEDVILSKIIEDKDTYRLYSPSNSIPQYTAALYDFELSYGVDPFQLSAYRDFMDQATGVRNQGYTVTIPPFETGRPDLDNKGYQPDTALLGLLNVKYLVSAYEVSSNGVELLGGYPEGYIYINEFFLPRAWIQPNESVVEIPPIHQGINHVDSILKKPNQVIVNAKGPGKLILSEIAYPGWSAKINDENVEILPVYDILQAVEIPPGEHEVVFLFRPDSIFLGLILGLFGWIYFLYRNKNKDGNRLHS